MDDLDSKTPEELEALMESMVRGQATVPEPEPAPPPAPEPIPSEEAKPTEPEPEPEPAEPDPKELELQELRLKMEELEARAKHQESVAGKWSGEAGFLRREVERLKASRVAESQPDAYSEDPTPPPTQPKRDALTTWAIQDAIQKAGAAFNQAHPDLPEVQADMAKHLQESQANIQDVLGMDDPIEAYKQVTTLMEAAYYRASAERKARLVQETRERRATQTAKLDEMKRKATISASGSAPPPPPAAKTLNDLSVQELEEMLNRLPR